MANSIRTLLDLEKQNPPALTMKNDLRVGGFHKTDVTALLAYFSVLIPIVCCEISIIVLSSMFFKYVLKLDWFYAISFATTIEALYMVSSGLTSKKAKITRWVLLSVSVVTVNYSAYLNDDYVISQRGLIKDQQAQINERLVQIQKELKSFSEKDEILNDSLRIYNRESMVSKGLAKIGSQENLIEEKRNERIKEQKNLYQEKQQLAKNLQDMGFFNNFSKLSSSTKLLILIFIALQFSISLYLPDIIAGIKKELSWKKP